MRKLLQAIHALPEDVRKLLAGVCIVASALVFFSVWGSWVSSRLVTLGPAPASSTETVGQGEGVSSSPTVRVEPRTEPPSPAQGLAETFSGVRQMSPISNAGLIDRVSQMRRLFAAIGKGASDSVDFIYLKLAQYVPANL